MALIDDLEKEGFDTSQITPELISQLSKEGYDVSGLSRGETSNVAKPTQPDWMNEPGLQDVSLTPITKPDLEQAGEDTAVALGKRGYPKTGAALGTGVSMADDIAMALATLGGGNAAVQGAKELPAVVEGAAPVVQKGAGMLSKLARIISGPSRAAAGEAIGAAEKAGGISQTLPELKQLGQELGLKNATARQYVQRLTEMVKNGDIVKVPLQKLAEHEEQVGRLLDKEPQGFLGQMLNSDKSQLGKKGVALASKTRAVVSDLINNQLPARAEALADYGAAKARNKIYKGTAAAIGTAAVGGKARKVLKTMFSGGE